MDSAAIVALTIGLAGLVGISLGLLGGGGSILMVPILTYVAGMPAREAMAASLVVIGVTSLATLPTHARQGNVRWRIGAIFGGSGVVGAFAGGLAGGAVPATILMVGFAAMMLAAGTAMLRGRRVTVDQFRRERSVWWSVVVGLLVGFLSGLVGAGGGFLLVPALTLLGRLPLSSAVGTSLVVIFMNALAGFSGYVGSLTVPWGVIAPVSIAAVIGSLLGARLVVRIASVKLRRGFGYFVLSVAALVLVQEVPYPLGAVGAVLIVLGLVVQLICAKLSRSTIGCPWQRGHRLSPNLGQ